MNVPEDSRYSKESLFFAQNRDYLVGLYQAYQKDANSVSPEWRQWFEDFPFQDLEPDPPYFTPLRKKRSVVSPESTVETILATERLLRAYRQFGHRLANLDPLGLEKKVLPPLLKPETYGLKPDQTVYAFAQEWSVSKLLQHLHGIYGQTLALEFTHIEDPEEQIWLQNRLERRTLLFSRSQKTKFYEDLLQTEGFERFLHTKFPGAKRFSIEGNDSLIPALQYLVDWITGKKTHHLVIGMAHRGRLSVLAHLFKKPLSLIMAGFDEQESRKDFPGSGDVKYHQGYTAKQEREGLSVSLQMMHNASHLESIVPIALGRTYFLQSQSSHDPFGHDAALAVLIHGDAAFIGQGIVAESLQLAQLEGYNVGGALHVIVNNQIGFSTSPVQARTSWYCSDSAKATSCPILHVNADDVEAVVWAFELALDYRYRFHKDIVIDLVGYRRYGHNEGDEPTFSQPLLYKAIQQQPTTASLYKEKLERQGVLDSKEAQQKEKDFSQKLQQAFVEKVVWPPVSHNFPLTQLQPYTLKDLKERALQSLELPSSLHLHPKLIRFIDQRRQNISQESSFDWATAEYLAFASLLVAGCSVRLCGQDSQRGTFSQRHLEWIDTQTGIAYNPLKNQSFPGKLECLNSPLSEAAALGFEYGYSLGLQGLTLWEAQFGDFVNGAQVIIDQYLSAADAKWGQSSGLTLLLPHGYEGQGPEHSSARLERFLQLSAESNWRITVCSTPANLFHLLRDQATRRAPLIALTPKSLLRHPAAVSAWSELNPQNSFQTVLKDSLDHPEEVEKVIFCTGKVYYDLDAYRQHHNKKVAILRLEQLYPFPEMMLKQRTGVYKKAQKWIWCQEEPKNMGAWSFVSNHLQTWIPTLIYVGRSESSSPATGFLGRHHQEQSHLIEQAFTD